MQGGEADSALVMAAWGCLALAAMAALLGPARPRLRPLARLALPAMGCLAAIAGLTELAACSYGWSGACGPQHWPLFSPAQRLQLTASPLGAVYWLLLGLPLSAIGASLGAPAADRHRRLSLAVCAVAAIVLALTMAANSLTLIIAWQGAATLAAVLLAGNASRRGGSPVHTQPRRQTRAAGNGALGILVLLQTSGVCLLAAVLILDACGTSPGAESAAFLLTLGAASTALAALWVPSAAGAATTHGPRTEKWLFLASPIAVYPLILVLLRMPAPGPSWWGIPLIGVGAGLAVGGVAWGLWSLARSDGAAESVAAEPARGRRLAYRAGSMVQIGAMVLGLGGALALQAASPSAAAGGLIAACLCALIGSASITLLETMEEPRSAGRGGRGLPPRVLPKAISLLGARSTTVAAMIVVAACAVVCWITIQVLLTVALLHPAPLAGGIAAVAAAMLAMAAMIGPAAMALFQRAEAATESREDPPHPLAPSISGGAMPGSGSPGAAVAVTRAWPAIANLLLACPLLFIAMAPAGAIALLRSAARPWPDAAGAGGPLGQMHVPATGAYLFPVSLLACAALCTGVCALGARLRRGVAASRRQTPGIVSLATTQDASAARPEVWSAPPHYRPLPRRRSVTSAMVARAILGAIAQETPPALPWPLVLGRVREWWTRVLQTVRALPRGADARRGLSGGRNAGGSPRTSVPPAVRANMTAIAAACGLIVILLTMVR